MRSKKKTKNSAWHGPEKGAATREVLKVMHRADPSIGATIFALRFVLGGRVVVVPYAPVAQTVRRMRHAGLIRRADGKKGPGAAATYTLTTKGRKAAEKVARS